MKGNNLQNQSFWESGLKNSSNFKYYFYSLTELATTMFEYENLPDTVDPRFLEFALYNDGKAVFFKDEDIGYLGLRVNAVGQLNEYGIPYERYAYGDAGYNSRHLTEDDSIIIFNNYTRTPTIFAIKRFAMRLSDLDSIIDVNAKAQKTPVLIACEENQRLTMINTYKKYEGNEPYIFADKSLNPQSLRVLKTDAPFLGEKLYMLKSQIWNEALTYLGISNISLNKKERLITDEIMRNMGGTIAFRNTRLIARREGIKKINKMFGLNIKVRFREDFQIVDDETINLDELRNNPDKDGDNDE